MKPTPIEVEEYYKGAKYLKVFIKDIDDVLDIKRKDFESWIENEDLLNWLDSHVGLDGEEVQTSGRMSMRQYWEQDREDIYKDMANYVAKNQLITI